MIAPLIQAETLDLLEWPRLCQHLSTFASTKLGVVAAQNLWIPASLEQAQFLLAQTREVYDLESRLTNSLSFDGIYDIGEALQRAELQGVLSGEELLAIATTLAGTRNLRRVIDNQPEAEVLNQLVADLRTYPELEQEIHRCIDDRGQVADRASAKLAGIREQQRHLRDRVYDMLQRVLQRQANALQEQLITQRDGRFVLPVKSTHRDVIPGIIHDTSMSGATLYVEPHNTVPLNNQLRQMRRQEQAEEEAIRRALTEQVAAVREDLERLLAIVTALDLAAARARYSFWLGANPPRFIPFQPEVAQSTEPTVLRRLRHPLLVWQQQHEQGRAVVPIDLIIQPTIRVVAITGPNTGGKTVTLKTLGLAVLMAKVGLFIPANEPVELPWFDQVLADIGDEQSLQQSLSTFSGHIRRIVRILEALQPASDRATPEMPANPTSLVLLDEVGAGTDPSEGSALAIALLKHLAEHALLTVATTHFGELKALKYQDDRFENASVEFDDVSLSPTYRLLWGIPGRSNALTIAQRLGLAETVVEQARTYVGGASEDVNEVIAGLEQQRRRQESKAQEAAQLLAQAERLHQEVSRKAASLQQRERDLQAAQERAVQEAIVQARSEIAQVIRQLQRGPMTAQSAQQATDSLNQLADRHLPSRQQPAKPKPGFQPKTGDRIRIPRLGQTAEVLGVDDDKAELTVRFGLMKMTVALEDVESLDGEKPASTQKAPTPVVEASRGQAGKAKSLPTQVTAEAPAIRTSSNTVDLRGSRVADAEIELDRVIGSMHGPLWIIHGQGTGKLRQGIHTFLAQHPQIERYQLAEPSDGGTGVTIAHVR